MMARRTGNPRLARHHNKRKCKAQPAIEAARDDITCPNNISDVERDGHSLSDLYFGTEVRHRNSALR